ncbi:MAG TPA: chromosomal replication initiator protein DnaA [Candidatus Acidoferrales bacterium]|nr:chromosomal replication initiator protein DnaA [Candidatus Acidoferrales bacterium]
MHQAWQQTIDLLRDRIDPDDYESFIRRLRPVAAKDRNLLVEAPNKPAVDLITDRYLNIIEEVLSQRLGTPVRVLLQTPTAAQQELFPLAVPAPAATGVGKHRRSSTLIPKYTFDNFIVGASNQFAHAACKAVANLPGNHYNPLFLYGGVGLGKTHLVNAIGHQILDRESDRRVVYLSSESFMNELINALRRDRMDDFKARFRRVDTLIVDDVQFLAGRERTQEEFFHTFNSLYESRRQIVLTSDKFPKEIPELEERLRNRFEWGLIADIQPPDMETRVAILEKKAEVEHIELPHDVALFLASNIDSNVRELEGSLTRLGAFASLNKCEITVDFSRQVLQNILREKSSAITIDSIQRAVCDFFHVRPADLRSKKRTRIVALPRQVAMYLCRRYTDASFPAIGDRFGGRDHSTVIHATQVVEQRIKEDPTMRAAIDRLQRILESGG